MHRDHFRLPPDTLSGEDYTPLSNKDCMLKELVAGIASLVNYTHVLMLCI